MELEAEAPAHTGLAARRQTGAGLVPADAAIMAHRKRGRVDVINADSLSPAAAQKAQRREQYAWLKRHKPLITRHAGKIAAQYLSDYAIIKPLEIFASRAMQHQQNRHDFADAQVRLWPA